MGAHTTGFGGMGGGCHEGEGGDGVGLHFLELILIFVTKKNMCDSLEINAKARRVEKIE